MKGDKYIKTLRKKELRKQLKSALSECKHAEDLNDKLHDRLKSCGSFKSKLSELRILHIVSMEYGSIPSKDNAKELIQEVIPYGLGVQTAHLESLLEKHEGYSASNIADLIDGLINEFINIEL